VTPFDICAKSIQLIKDVLDLESDLESPSLLSQLVAVKRQLAEVQERLNESTRISHEKDALISKLRKAMAAQAKPWPTTPAFTRYEDAPPSVASVSQPRQATPIEAPEPIDAPACRPEQATSPQAEPPEELKLPAQASCPPLIQTSDAAGTCAVVQTTASPAEAATTSKPTSPARGQTTSQRTKPTRTRVAKNTDSKAPTTVRPKEATRTSRQAVTGRAKPTRTRAAAKKKASNRP